LQDNTRNGLIVTIMLLLVATAFTGTALKTIEINSDCQDGFDNDGDDQIDIEDDPCFEYPYADGNGEEETPLNQRYTSSNYVSLFDYHIENAPLGAEVPMICFAFETNMYNEEDQQKATNWFIENDVDCTGQGP
jgi:phosphatidylserine decarboxylase